uniref:Uncharacterized protein n=1 Tax=Ananas comosus var. bracteatus TaxID=296719 RepID=A0A6V7Q1J7_ANACO|nr:unnamed protein product [Ananas comosus var. bracteatus]
MRPHEEAAPRSNKQRRLLHCIDSGNDPEIVADFNPAMLCSSPRGAEQLYAFERSMAASIVAVGRGSNGYDLASPLAYLSKCPLNIELDNKVGAEKASPRPPPPKNSAPSTGGLPRSGNEAPPMGWGFRLFTYFPSYPSSEYPDLGELDWEYQLHV